MDKPGYVYIMTNANQTVLYTGVTRDLPRRVWEHKNGSFEGFGKKFNLTKLVYCEEFEDITEAIAGEKRIKAGSRKKKEELIGNTYPGWLDLGGELD